MLNVSRRAYVPPGAICAKPVQSVSNRVRLYPLVRPSVGRAGETQIRELAIQ